MLASEGGSWCSLLQLTKFLTHKLLFQRETPRSWPPISLNNSTMQKKCRCLLALSSFAESPQASRSVILESVQITGLQEKLKSLHQSSSLETFVQKWHHLTHYQGPDFCTSSELMLAMLTMNKRSSHLLCWAFYRSFPGRRKQKTEKTKKLSLL